MPLYEYICESCGRTIEALQSFREPPLTICDRCGGNLKKLMSAPAVQFKGSGWYVSDYGRPGKPESKSNEGSGESRPAETTSENAAETPREKAKETPKEKATEKTREKTKERASDKPSDKPAKSAESKPESSKKS